MAFLFRNNNKTALHQHLVQDADSVDTKKLEEARHNFLLESQTNGEASATSVFNLAYWLIASPKHEDKDQGVLLLKELLKKDPQNREYLYYLALGCYKLQDYVLARQYANQLLDIEPANRQALSLKNLAEEKVAKDGLVGMMIVGGAAAAIASGVVLLMKARR